MQHILRLLAAGVFALLSGAASAQTIEFATVDPSAVAFATFNSNTQKIARNKNGTLVAYVKETNAAYDAQRINFVRIDQAGTQSLVLSEVHATNAPCIEASATGEFFAAFSDWSLGVVRVYVWRDLSASTVPEKYAFSTAGSGKFSCSFDENRRILYYLGYDGKLVRFGVDGLQFAASSLWYQASNVAQYPNLQASRDGSLHVFWNTLTGTAVSYRGVQYLTTPNDAVNWYRNWHPAGTANAWLQSPTNYMPVASDESGASFSLSRGEDYIRNSYLLAAYADDEVIGAFWQSTPNYMERCFGNEKRCTAVLVMYDRKTAARTLQMVPMLIGRNPIRPQGGGGFVKRGSSLHLVWSERNDIVVAKLTGNLLTEVAREPIPGATDANCPYSLTIEKGNSADNDIVGVLTVLDATCSTWATYSGSAPVTGSVLRFRVAL